MKFLLLFLALIFPGFSLGNGANPNAHFQPRLQYRERAMTLLSITLLNRKSDPVRFNNPFMTQAHYRIGTFSGVPLQTVAVLEKDYQTDARGKIQIQPAPDGKTELRIQDFSLPIQIEPGEKNLILLHQNHQDTNLPSILSSRISTQGLESSALRALHQDLVQASSRLKKLLEQRDGFAEFLDPEYRDKKGKKEDFTDFLMLKRKAMEQIRIQKFHLRKFPERILITLEVSWQEGQKSQDLDLELDLSTALKLKNYRILNAP